MKVNIGNLAGLFCVDLQKDFDGMILVAGSGRSGTTWIGDVINYRNDFRVAFEPMDSRKDSRVNILGLRPYFGSRGPSEAERKALELTLRGLPGNFWVNRYNRKFVARRRLVKEIRANLILPWIQTEFPEIKIVYVLRHPVAVAMSRIEAKWSSHLAQLLAIPGLSGHFSNSVWSLIKSIEGDGTEYEKHFAQWIIENWIPYGGLDRQKAVMVYYENLVGGDVMQWARLLEFCEVTLDEKKVRDAMGQRSRMTARQMKEAVRSGRECEKGEVERRLLTGATRELLVAMGLTRYMT